MSERAHEVPALREVPIANLLLDLMNPRLEEQPSQRDAIRALVQHQGSKFLVLAEDILEHGLDPSSAPIAIPDETNDGQFIVLEGNRRLSALKVLENPELGLDLFGSADKKRLEGIADSYSSKPIARVRCAIFGDRKSANRWIELRHRGEQGGKGLVSWGNLEATRFEERQGKESRSSAAVHALDIVRSRGRLDADTASKLPKVPITTVQRLLNDPAVRRKLGIESKSSPRP